MSLQVFDLVLSVDTGPHVAGDLLSDVQVLTDVMPKVDGQATLRSVKVLDKDDQGEPMSLYLTTSSTSWGTENSPPTITDDEAENIQAAISIPATEYQDIGGFQIAQLSDLNKIVKGAANSRDLYLAAVTAGTPTHSASGVEVRLEFEWED